MGNYFILALFIIGAITLTFSENKNGGMALMATCIIGYVIANWLPVLYFYLDKVVK